MKTLGLLLCLVGIATTALAEEYLWDNFDAYPIGSIADQPGWTCASWLSTQTAQVSAAESFSPSNSIELAWHADGSSAVTTNFSSTYVIGAEHPVLRFAARLYIENTNVPFQVGLRNSAAGHFLSFQNNNGSGAFGFHLSSSGIPLVTGKFVNLMGYYNRSNNTYRLDYDNVTVVPWSPSDDIAHTQFNQFLVTRLTNTASTTGDLFVDNVRVETFPPYVTAWWRCNSLADYTDDCLGQLYLARRETYGVHTNPSSSDPLYDGQFDFHNGYTLNRFIADHATNSTPTPASSNWTVEGIFRTPEGDGSLMLINWGTDLGFNTNGATISFSYSESYQQFLCNLRDAEQPDSTDAYIRLGDFTSDDQWHHTALIKSNATISLYLDYQWVTNVDLTTVSDGTAADGTYPFETDSRVSVGTALNGAAETGDNTIIDEVRFSAKALELHEFLQPGQPLLVDLRNSALLDPWDLTVKVILDRTYRVETSPALGAAANWQKEGLSFVGAYTFQFIDVSTVTKTNFVRIIREN